MLVIAVTGYFFGEDAAQGQIMTQISGQIGQNGAQTIQALLAASRDATSGIVASVIATLLMFIGATSVFTELKISLDEIWGCNQTCESPVGGLIKTRLLSFVLILLLALLLVTSLMANAIFGVLENYAVGIWSSFAALFSLLSSIVAYGCLLYTSDAADE